jgi:hypothetical protein
MICANVLCKIEFIKNTHNQKYCSDECCRLATNARIMEKYYEKKSIKHGKTRLCKGCGSALSRYNSSLICSLCEKRSDTKTKNKLNRIINELG